MAKQTVKVSVDYDTGDIVIETEGFEGDACYKTTEKLEKMLGQVIETKPTGERYKPKKKEVQYWTKG